MLAVAEEWEGEVEAWEEGEDVVTETILLLDRQSELLKDLIKVRILRFCVCWYQLLYFTFLSTIDLVAS